MRENVPVEALDLLRQPGQRLLLVEHVEGGQGHGRPERIAAGSAIVDIIERNLGDPVAIEKQLKEYVSGMKAAAQSPQR